MNDGMRGYCLPREVVHVGVGVGILMQVIHYCGSLLYAVNNFNFKTRFP